MHAVRFSVVPASYVYLLKDGEVLLQQRKGTGYMDGMWVAGAAGHIELGETAAAAAVREVREELLPRLGEPPGEESFRRVSLSEARADELALDQVPCGAVGVADDLLFADDLVALADAVEVASAARLLARLQNLRQDRVRVAAHLP